MTLATIKEFFAEDYTANPSLKLSEHFTITEFHCRDGARMVFVAKELVDVLEDVRKHFNSPVTINSGYRTVAYNSKISGASPKSQHTLGKAADIVVRNQTPERVYAYLTTKYTDKFGIGIYDSFVHVDVRDKKSRWDYRKAGT